MSTMEAKDVLAHFMEMCHGQNEFFRQSLASNAVLDWFGRTIQGNKCIERFLQCDVWPQYEQNFVAAVACDSIETRPTHEQAKETPIENAILCTSSEVPSASGYDSPPPSKRNLDKPPPLHRNKRSKRHVKEYQTASSSSDDECETQHKSYNLRRTACEGTWTSQSKNVIQKPESKIAQTPDRSGRLLRKRIVEEAKTSPPTQDDRSSSPMKRSKKMLDSINGTCGSSSSMDCSSSTGVSNFTKPYSELKYLESIGSIRTIRRAKHPGINKVPSAKAITATPFVSPESQNGWDRKTKLKISYRTGLVKTDLQFALIIYEPLTMITRRNLLDEFERAAEEEQHQNKSSSKTLFTSPLASMQKPAESSELKTPTIRAKPKNDKVSSLRRLRF